MTTTQATPVALSHEQIAEMLDLLKGSDSVELKLTVPEYDQRSAVVALGMDPLEAQIRQVFFFDTPDLALDKQRRRRPRAPDPGQGRRLGREAAAGRAGRASRRAPRCGRLSRRGRRDARRLRLLGSLKRTLDPTAEVKTRRRRRACRSASCSRRSSAPSSRSTRPRASSSTTCRCSGRSSCSSCGSRRRSSAAGSSPRCGSTPTARACSSSRRSALHDRGVPGRGRGTRVPRKQGHRSLGRAADEDEEGARVLRGRAQERELSRDEPGRHTPVGVARLRRELRRRRDPSRGADCGSARRRATISTCSRSRATPRSRCAAAGWT